MALQAKGQKFCKVFYYENGKADVRRVHEMRVAAADGRVYPFSGDELPDTIVFQSGASYSGAHLMKVFLNPESVKASQLLTESSDWVTKRDVYFAVMGVMLYKVSFAFAEAAAISLSY